MATAFWSRMWQLHDETKALMFCMPKAMVKYFDRDHVFLINGKQEDQVDIAEKLEDTRSEHCERITSGPGGVEEGEPREYTTRQSQSDSIKIRCF